MTEINGITSAVLILGGIYLISLQNLEWYLRGFGLFLVFLGAFFHWKFLNRTTQRPENGNQRYVRVSEAMSRKKVKLIEIILTVGGLLIAASAITTSKSTADSSAQQFYQYQVSIYQISLFGFVLFSFLYYYVITSKFKTSKDILLQVIRMVSFFVSIFFCFLMIVPLVPVIAVNSAMVFRSLIPALVVLSALTYGAFIVAILVIFRILMNEIVIVRTR
jgi:membrane protease YdiL (CAAX protease family)